MRRVALVVSPGHLDGPCVQKPLPNGDLLVLRDVVVDAGHMKTIEAVLVHPDRSGIGAEAGNWTIEALPNGTSVSQSELPSPRVTRPDPVYTIDQLAQLVLAVDEAVKGVHRNELSVSIAGSSIAESRRGAP